VSRTLAFALIGVMLMVVIGQALQLRGFESTPVTEIRLHESRLVPFLEAIRAENPDTYDSILLNLSRIRDGQPQVQDYQLEETVIAEQLILRLTGQATASGGPAGQPLK
jgi:hypothetical protein